MLNIKRKSVMSTLIMKKKHDILKLHSNVIMKLLNNGLFHTHTHPQRQICTFSLPNKILL